MRHHKPVELITTTSTVEGIEIESYQGVVSHQIVIGANLFKDVFSSFRDVFGGAAKGYQKELEKWKRVGISELEKKAINKSANGIIGLNMDFESVSGGNKSMFMISLSGTAVQLKRSESYLKETTSRNIEIDRLDYLVKKKELELELKNKSPKTIVADDIKNYKNHDIDADDVIFSMVINEELSYLESYFDEIVYYFQDKSHRLIDQFLSSEKFREDYEIRHLINHYGDPCLYDFLEEIQWFNFSVLKSLLKSNNHDVLQKALHLLKLNKSNYKLSDAKELLELASSIDEAYSIYPVREKKQKTLGKDKIGWRCVRCDSFQEESFSKCTKCGANIYGIKVDKITPDEISKKYRLMAEAIQEAVG